MSSEIINEEMQTVTIMEIKKTERPSKYMDRDYTLAWIIDQYGRKIAAAGYWVENWQVGDVVKGILQEKVAIQGRSGNKEENVVSSLFLKNPSANY